MVPGGPACLLPYRILTGTPQWLSYGQAPTCVHALSWCHHQHTKLKLRHPLVLLYVLCCPGSLELFGWTGHGHGGITSLGEARVFLTVVLVVG